MKSDFDNWLYLDDLVVRKWQLLIGQVLSICYDLIGLILSLGL